MTRYRILDMSPVYFNPITRDVRYAFQNAWPGGRSYPWVKQLDTEHIDPDRAYAEAVRWAQDYEAIDRLGNMAAAIGVSSRSSSPGSYRYRGVVNYYHSNT